MATKRGGKNDGDSIKAIKKKDKVLILGFAPSSLKLAPIDDNSFDVWPINELYAEVPKLLARADAWFQLHGFEPPKLRDPDHKHQLAQMACPIVMWKRHPEIPNSVEYPVDKILTEFDTFGPGMALDIPNKRDRVYFTNSISWLIVLAVYLEYKEIHIYGVDMAQDQEYKSQRPSCEFYIGWARGRGIKVYLPIQSDLCRSWVLYGYDDGGGFMMKLYARLNELGKRVDAARGERVRLQNQAQQALAAEHQLMGAIEDNKYMINLGPRGIADDIHSEEQVPQVSGWPNLDAGDGAKRVGPEDDGKETKGVPSKDAP